MEHLDTVNTTTKYTVEYVTATVPVYWNPNDGQYALSVQVMMPVHAPITAAEAFKLVMFAANQTELDIRDCALDSVELVRNNTLSLSLGT